MQSLEVQYNTGGYLLDPTTPNTRVNPAASQLVRVEGGEWLSMRDLVDLDGDGLPEAIDLDPGGGRYRHDHLGQPPRLLTSIDNGRGARTEIRYAPMTDSAVVLTPDRTSPRSGWTRSCAPTCGSSSTLWRLPERRCWCRAMSWMKPTTAAICC